MNGSLSKVIGGGSLDKAHGTMVSPNAITIKPSGVTSTYLSITSVVNTSLTLAPVNGVLHLGASGGTPGHATNSGDVYIPQILEVDGAVTCDSTLSVSSIITCNHVTCNGDIMMGNGQRRIWMGAGVANASTDFWYLIGRQSTAAGNEACSVAFYAGYNSTDVGRYAPVMVLPGSSVSQTTYATAFTNQADPVFAVFSHQVSGSGVTKCIYMKHDDTDGHLSTLAGDLILDPATGVVRFGTKTGTGDAAVDGYVPIKDVAGNSVKLATVA